jgi:glycosyltransferase involved in cell wall biosynthesis
MIARRLMVWRRYLRDRLKRELAFREAREPGPLRRTAGFVRRTLRRETPPPLRRADDPPVFNVNGAPEGALPKRALLAYLARAFHFSEDDPAFLRHQNVRQCRQIAQVLGELGYEVDAVDRRDEGFVPDRGYDLVIGERLDWKGMDRHFRPDTRSIFLASTMSHATHNRNLRRRHEQLARRRRCSVPPQRIYREVMPAVRSADAIAGFGNQFILETWREVFDGPLYPFSNYGFQDAAIDLEGKDFAEARRHFVYFASRTQVQKGLDLLLEVFPRLPDLHLWACGPFEREEEFCACYRRELYETPNIHPVGWVGVAEPQFAELVRRCAYVIHPTCSEGQPGSVVHCMHQGLIPLVTPEAGIDTQDFGITLPSDDLDALERLIAEVAARPESWHEEHSRRTRAAAARDYGEDTFLARWREIILAVEGAPVRRRS